MSAMSDRDTVPSVSGLAADNVKRFRDLQRDYPEARFTFAEGWFYGALHDDDQIIRAADLGRLIDKLLARESGK
jgi:hypothetical protein